MEMINLGIIEDESLVRQNLEQFLAADPRLQIQVSASSVEAFLAAIPPEADLQPSIILLDISLPGMSGLEGIPAIRKVLPATDIIMLTTFEESDKIFKALCAGACSYLSKRTSLRDILETVITVHRGGSYMSPAIARKVVAYFSPAPRKEKIKLTRRQLQIVDALVNGNTYQKVAEELGISVETVRSHIKKIYKALEINSKAELIRKAFNGDL